LDTSYRGVSNVMGLLQMILTWNLMQKASPPGTGGMRRKD